MKILLSLPKRRKQNRREDRVEVSVKIVEVTEEDMEDTRISEEEWMSNFE